MFSGIWCMRVSDTSHQSSFGGSFLLNLSESITISLNIKTEEWALKTLWFNSVNDLALASVETYYLEVCGYVSLKRATASA